MRITSIKSVPISYKVPEGQNVRLGIGRAVKRDAVLVKVTTDEGLVDFPAVLALSPGHAKALRVLREFVESPENCFEFRLGQGQIFFLNNHLVAHGRSAFADSGARSPGTPG